MGTVFLNIYPQYSTDTPVYSKIVLFFQIV